MSQEIFEIAIKNVILTAFIASDEKIAEAYKVKIGDYIINTDEGRYFSLDPILFKSIFQIKP